MPNVELTDEQVVQLVRRLPPERQRAALLALASGVGEDRANRMLYAEEQLRRRCAERGLDWDRMSDDDRETFVDGLIHEDRSCRP